MIKDHEIARLVNAVCKALKESPAMPKLPESLRAVVSAAITSHLTEQQLRADHKPSNDIIEGAPCQN